VKAKKLFSFALVAVLSLGVMGLAGCGTGTTNEPAGDTSAEELTGSITVGGSDTMVNLAQALAEVFMDENAGVDISVTGGGTGTGIAALINGTVDFANGSRPMKDEEKVEAEAANGSAPVEYTVAYDGIAVIVNPALGVDGLTLAQLGAIYRGEIVNWSEVGGPDKEIVVLSRDSASGTYEFFLETVVQAEDEEALYATTARLLPSTQAIVDETVANDGAIGYVGLGYVVPEVEVLEIDGVAASAGVVKDGSYTIARPLFMYAAVEPDGAAQVFIEWILGDGQAVVEELGFVTVQ